MPEVHEIIFYGRSGDGIHMIADQLVQTLIKRGFYVISYPEYDPERRETLAKVHIRVSKEPINAREPVSKPEIAVFFDVRLLQNNRETIGVGKLIVNAPSKELVSKYLGNTDAHVISIDIHGLRRAGSNYPQYVVDSVLKALFSEP
ncbi:2-oxoacid:acceptor oxidoreductase family protein [Vulcanisaeta souniana]|uniref:pyruvate synthase n=1 Tax=Vulcanisaeta souniana JCM 11219 TaxID=1293586 RepID=A0A830EEH7_9CREN|nr:2-oxoacid:acceptor oxidoreductase family protein [Vulcanisaeta souniana]BDR92359.1 hypothetical protein Vsou_14520 [Vulcanisaeta souniana JCM 11219]GGI74961.1 hypothetical protein GCM10007112_09700 [Vulcanisaeta souniana JCM 11219]